MNTALQDIQAQKDAVWKKREYVSYRDKKRTMTFRAAYWRGGKEGRLYKIRVRHKALKCDLCKRPKNMAAWADYQNQLMLCDDHKPVEEAPTTTA